MKTETKTNEIIQIVDDSGLEFGTAVMLKEKFLPFFDKADEWKKKAEALVVTDASQTEKMKEARRARLALKEIRVEADKTRKELKEDSIRYGRAVQGVYNVIDFLIRPLEAHLQKQEDFVKEQEKLARQKLEADRRDEVAPYSEYIPVYISLGDLADEDYKRLLNGAKIQAKQAEEERQRIAKEAAEREERRRIREERMRAAAPVSSFIDGYASMDLGNISQEQFDSIIEDAKNAKTAYEGEQARIKAENERLERERKVIEDRAKKEREAAEKKAAAERKRAEDKLREERRIREELERQQREREEADRKAKEIEAARDEEERIKAEKAPDKIKITALIASISSIRAGLPEMKSKSGKEIINDADLLLSKLITLLTDKSNEL